MVKIGDYVRALKWGFTYDGEVEGVIIRISEDEEVIIVENETNKYKCETASAKIIKVPDAKLQFVLQRRNILFFALKDPTKK